MSFKVLALLTVLLAAAAAPAPARAADLRLTSDTRLSPRLHELTFETTALPEPTHVRILLPKGYDSRPGRRWPVLYLLHGAVDSYESWTTKGDAEAITAELGGIVVMPDSGPSGGYVDWYDDVRPPNPKWETYHIKQLLPWIDGHYRAAGTRAQRAVAGLSMGGFGAMSYAARHPDLFASATSLSGAVDTNYAPLGAVTEFNNGDPGSVHGPRATEEVRWRGSNPWDLALNLRPLATALRTGNGSPGGPAPGDLGDPVESGVHEASVSLHKRLDELDISHVWDDYGPGGHNWYYWQRGLRQLVPSLNVLWRDPPAPPPTVGYRSIDPAYTVFGWRVQIDRPALEFSELTEARRPGFVLSGSGQARVHTPARYRPKRLATVTIDGIARKLRVGLDCRLTVPVDLGPGNPQQQYRLGSTTAVRSARVAIARAGRCGRVARRQGP